MTLPPNTRARLHLSGDIDIENVDNSGAVSPSPETETVTLTGRVVQARTGTALRGLRVFATACVGPEEPIHLGAATSGADGRFRIQFEDRAEVKERLLALLHLPDSRLMLRIESPEGKALLKSAPVPLGRAEIDITIAVPLDDKPVAAKAWAALGKQLREHRIARLSDLVRLLNRDAPADGLGTASGAVQMLTRQAMLDQLEQAFVDPAGILRKTGGGVPSLQMLQDPEEVEAYAHALTSGLKKPEVAAAFSDMQAKARSFATLADVDWVIDPATLEHGDIGAALNRFSDSYKFDHNFPHIETNLTLYRDYLLAIWTSNAIKIVYDSSKLLTEQQALRQLGARFHQNLQTFDEKPRSANAVLIIILTSILTAAKGKGFGFGVAASAIKPEGTRTPRAYLDELIGLTGLSAAELGLRYLLDFTRSDADMSNPVQENIATLQGFFRDSFQSVLDPDHVDPDIHDQPIIPDKWIGNAPFFLYYDEWLRQQQPFYPENHLDVRRVLPVEIDQKARDQLASMVAGAVSAQKANIPIWRFCQNVLAVWDRLQAGHAQFYLGEYNLALIDYRQARAVAYSAMDDNVLQGLPMSGLYNQRRKLPLASMRDLANFMNPRPELAVDGLGFADKPDWARDRLALRLAYYALFTIPVCIGDAEAALGDFEHAIFHYGQATRFQVAIARETDLDGYRRMQSDWQPFYRGDKPYTVRLPGPTDPDASKTYFREEDDPQYDEFYKRITTDSIWLYAETWSTRIPHLAESRYCRLRQANAMLEWADALYRIDEPTSSARARELYKGVLWLHGRIPPIDPSWPQRSLGGGGISGVFHPAGIPTTFLRHDENPALTSQTTRALRGLYQIDLGLNYYGERPDIVPILRYRTLKNAADRAAAMARGAQQDFVQYTERIEDSIRGNLQLSNFLQKARLQSAIADEQHAIALHDVAVAQEQVAAVEAAIKAKQDEIAKHDSLWGQIGDAIKGVKSIVEDIPDSTKSAVGAGVTTEATGDAMVGEGMLGLGAGASAMTGIGIFAVVGYVTLSGMADAANQRLADLSTLGGKALPAAQSAVDARQHGVTITNYQKQIAQADIDLAQLLVAFEQNRTENQAFWLQLAQVARRLLRRYLEMGARLSWLAERALAYEQDRVIRVVRMDYFPALLQGVTGADMMQADLAELEMTRVERMKSTVPVRRTLSLAREFPVQYGQLKQTGRCGFRTEETFFRRAYPGTSAYRLRAVSVAVQQVDFSEPLRGSLINRGVSIARPGLPGEHVLVRPSEVLPLSEFRLQNDMLLYGLPNEMLLTFEGSSVETFWELGFPKAANPIGLDGLVDVLVTFDAYCEYAPERYETDLLAIPNTERKWLLISAAQSQAAELAGLAGAAPKTDIVFDLRRLRLFPRQQTMRKLKNVAAYAITHDDINFIATLATVSPATSAVVTFQHGFAMSTLQPDPAMPPLPASPLNAFADLDPDQTFTLSISKATNPSVDFQHVTDMVLALEYEATVA